MAEFLSGLKKGGLHKALGIKQGEKIPASKLQAHKNSSNEHMRKMIQFAINAKHWNKK